MDLIPIDNLEEIKPKDFIIQKAKLRVRPTDKVEKPATVLSVNGGIIGTAGNFSMLIGKAKTKKSFLVNLMVASAVDPQGIMGEFRSQFKEGKDKVIYFDTEQGKYHVWEAVKRITTQIKVDNPENLEVYRLRKLSPIERLNFIGHFIKSRDDIGFVVIDGIKDLITSINDESEATAMASKLLKWTEENDIHIICVLHQNKGDMHARGHIGSELQNKAETVISVSKSDNNKDISLVEPVFTRNMGFEPFGFTINKDGIPEFVSPEVFHKEINTNINKKWDPLIKLTDEDLEQLVVKIFHNNKEGIKYKHLWIDFKKLIFDIHGKEIGNTVAQNVLNLCVNKELIYQPIKKREYFIYSNVSV